MAVVGIDGCKAGWFAVRFDSDGDPLVQVFGSIQSLWTSWGVKSNLCLIDVPIGLSDSDASRSCDALARQRLGSPRASSVFNPPVRSALTASSWDEAAGINKAKTGKRITLQTWGIALKIREVDEFLRVSPDRQAIIREVHPELLFQALNDGTATSAPKKRSSGIEERLEILERHYPGAPGIARRAFASFRRRDVQRDDVVDALVSAVVGTLYLNKLRPLPENPPFDAHGLVMEMVIPVLAGTYEGRRSKTT